MLILIPLQQCMVEEGFSWLVNSTIFQVSAVMRNWPCKFFPAFKVCVPIDTFLSFQFIHSKRKKWQDVFISKWQQLRAVQHLQCGEAAHGVVLKHFHMKLYALSKESIRSKRLFFKMPVKGWIRSKELWEWGKDKAASMAKNTVSCPICDGGGGGGGGRRHEKILNDINGGAAGKLGVMNICSLQLICLEEM